MNCIFRLQTGWSASKTPSLRQEEQEAIIAVIKRNEMLETAERQRVGKLVDRVEKVKQRVGDYGLNQCRLCGDKFGLFSTKMICDDCLKPVCTKCSIELPSNLPMKRYE